MSGTLSKLAYDALGSSAKHVGEELILPETKLAIANLKKFLHKVLKRKAELGLDAGSVPPRVLPSLARSAAVCDDSVVQAYLAGVACSAHTKNGRDDRAVAMLRLIEGLSSYAIRAHSIVYASVLRQKDHKLSDVKKWLMRGYGVTLLFDEATLQKQMAFEATENADAILEHAFVNLSANDLTMQGASAIRIHKTQEKARFMHLTLRGVELFCWGPGVGQTGIDGFFSNTLPPSETESLAIAPRKLELGIVSWN
jgi:hypothetical protein